MQERSAKDYMDILQWSITEQKDDLSRLQSLQDSYDNKINSLIWPTQSEIPTAQHFVATEEALAPALDLCFPDSNGIQLIPSDGVPEESWRNAEWALWTMVHYTMNLKKQALRSIKDCFKCSVGYSIVEPFIITPDTGALISTGGKKMRIMAQGEPQVSIRCRYRPPGNIIPYPSGTDFNGPEATPMSFHLDPHPAWEVEEMFSSEGKKRGPLQFAAEDVQGTWEEVQEAARNYYNAGLDDFFSFASRMAGRKKPTLPNDIDPLDIPIIKIFEQPGSETWIVPRSLNDAVIILRRESDGVTQLRNPLIKWSAWPDGLRWYPMSQPEADQKRAFAYDLWLNFFYDMMSRAKDPRLVVSKSALSPDQRTLHPFEDIFVDGADARSAASYLESPRIDPSIATVGDVLEKLGNRIAGRNDFMQKNYTRGGTNAFNDLLNSMQARQKLAATILETGALTQVFEHVLTYMQQLAPESGYNMSRPIYDPEDKKTLIERRTITPEDLRHGYSLTLDTGERRMLGGMSDQQRLQYWQTLIDRPDVRKEEVNKIFPLPETNVQRIFLGPEKLAAQQEEQRQLQLLGALGGVGGGGAGAPQAAPPEAAGAGAGAPGLATGAEGVV